MTLTCPRCKGAIAFDPALAGQQVSCPHCQGLLQMPVIKTTSTPAAVVQPESESSMDFTSSEPSPSSRRRQTGKRSPIKTKKPSTTKTVLKWVGGIWLCLMILGGIGRMAGDKKGKKDDGGGTMGMPVPQNVDGLTANYLPHKVGARAGYEIEVALPNGPPNMVTWESYRFDDGGVLNVKTDGLYSRENGKDTKIKGSWELRDIPVQRFKRRVANGFVEEIGDETTERPLKIGAKPGDSWDTDLGHGVTQRSKLVELGQRTFDYDGKKWPSAKVATVQTIRGLPESTLSWESIYIKNVGLIEKRVTDHTGKEVSVWTLSTARNFADLTDSERKFYEGK